MKAEPEPQPVVAKPAPATAPAPVAATAANHSIRTYNCSCCGAIKIEKLMPEKVQLNQPFDYTIQVTNLTDMLLSDIVVKENLPAGFKYQRSPPAGKLDGNTLTWMMASLGPKASEKIVVTGTASEVGKNETYIITVTNQGTAPDTNIKIKVFLEDSMQFISAGGATRGAFVDGAVTFEALPSLAPKAKTTWQVVVKAVKAGDVRLRVTMNTDELERDVVETEATRFFE
jgi:uncharacterized repeat protein (TIGR01451 family)